MQIRRFYAIEGLRGYLAWAVVADHVAWWSGFRGPLGNLLRDLGQPAVALFMVVSGYVICHLIVERPEPYRFYIVRRFLRIFPLFAVCGIAGYFVYPLPLAVRGIDVELAKGIASIVNDTEQHFWAHVIAHLTMLHGVVSDSLLPSSQYAFTMVAWTVSIEWQFYLVAPFIIIVLHERPATATVVLAVLLLTRWMFRHEWFGHYEQPSLLPALGDYFAAGIARRLLYPRFVGKINLPVAGASVILFYMMTKNYLLTVWLTVYLGLLIEQPPRLYQLALESPLVKYLGSRSYSAFLGHFLVINVSVWLWYRWTGTAVGFMPLLLLTVPSTLLLSEVLYRCIELPGIALGVRLCQRLNGGDGLSIVYQSSYGSTP